MKIRIFRPIFIIFFVILSTFNTLPESQANTYSLNELIQADLASKGIGFSHELLSSLKQKQIFFVDGIMNGLAKAINCYFEDNIKVVKKLDIPYVHKGYPSTQSIPHNAEQLYIDIKEAYQKTGRPIILFGHSMGGAEILYTLLKYPELLLFNWVERAIIIQAPIGGSPLADHPKKGLISKFLVSYLGEGLDSLTPRQSKSNYEQVFTYFKNSIMNRFCGEQLACFEKTYQEMSRKVFFVTSKKPTDRKISWGLRRVLDFCSSAFLNNDNDGLVNTVDQALDPKHSFGTILEPVTADHIELVVSGLVSKGSKKIRKAFTRAVLQTAYGHNFSFDDLLGK